MARIMLTPPWYAVRTGPHEFTLYRRGATLSTPVRRLQYGGRKAKSARRRLGVAVCRP